MPIPHIRMIYCDCCGKLLKVEEFGDAMTPEEWEKFNNFKVKKICWKCRLLRKNDN